MKPPYRLVPDSLSHDTVQALEQLLDHAREGHIIGIAFAAMYKRRQFITNTAGECYRNPVFARGMVAALDDELSARGRAS
jgi:hypothetical protein